MKFQTNEVYLFYKPIEDSFPLEKTFFASLAVRANIVQKIWRHVILLFITGDFGLSREKKGLHTSFTHTCPGTPHYMALDILRGDVTVKSDMYSFGVIVLEILTGLTVFDPMRKHTHITDYVDDKDAQQVLICVV